MPLSRGRLRRIFRTFDSIYVSINVMLFMSLLCYTQHFVLSNTVSQVIAAILFAVGAILIIFFITALDALRDKNLYRRIFLYSSSLFFCFSLFVMFRFWRDIFSKEVQSVLKQTIEIGIFRAELGVLMAGPFINLVCFSLKYIVLSIRGREVVVLNCPWKPYDLRAVSRGV